MLILPAIDLQAGACVRLLFGAFDTATRYGDPLEQLALFAASGSAWVHVVDLDGARLGAPAQRELIAQLAERTDLKLQCGGGVRERTHVEALLRAGIERVVVGSVAARRPDEVRAWLDAFGAERICVALDVRPSERGWDVALDGWTTGSGCELQTLLNEFPPGQVRHVLVTDISRDGALTGPNSTLMRELIAIRPDIRFQASGGVASLDDLRTLKDAGASAVIVGRALYERCFTLEDALAV